MSMPYYQLKFALILLVTLGTLLIILTVANSRALYKLDANLFFLAVWACQGGAIYFIINYL